MKRIRHFAPIIALVGLVVSFLGVLLMLSWALASEEVLVVNNAPFPTRKTGDVVVLNVDYCKNRAIKGQVRVSFISQTKEVFLPLGSEDAPKGCQKADFPIILPKDLTSDTYKIKFRTTYNINPLKKGIISEFESQQFKIE